MQCEDFNSICRLGNNPDDILVHFEKTASNAMQHPNQNIEIKSCFYNLSSNVWERIHYLRLQQQHNENLEFAFSVKMLSAIAFQSPNDVIQGFRELEDRLHNVYNRDADDLLHYFEGNTFVGIEDTLEVGSQMFQLKL